jgi:hypothetical protein
MVLARVGGTTDDIVNVAFAPAERELTRIEAAMTPEGVVMIAPDDVPQNNLGVGACVFNKQGRHRRGPIGHSHTR